MKIIFICGSLEPGRDGVGDYTRRLAINFICLGHQTEIIAINEKKLLENHLKSFQKDGSISVITHRLSAKISWRKRQRTIKEIISLINPEIISLQFVPFSFQNKGLPYFLAYRLSKIGGSALKWHFMFHELWVADSKASSLKEWLIGALQKAIIKNLLIQFKDSLINTSNFSYYKMLKKIGFEAGIFPIFSNLPKGKKQALPYISNRNEKIVGVFFGHLQENPNFYENICFFRIAIESQMKKELVILHIGNNRNPKTLKLIKQLSSQLNIQTISMGFLNAQEAADIIYNADIGLSNYPIDLIHKSGSIASMLYNELPVILLVESKSTTIIDGFPEVMPWDGSLDLNRFINQKPNFADKYNPKFTAEKLEKKFLNKINDNLSNSNETISI